MKKIALKTLLLIYSSLIFSQSKSKEITFTKDSDTINIKNYYEFLSNTLKFQDITNKKEENIFRFWTFGKFIEVSKSDTLYNGKINFLLEDVKCFGSDYFNKTYILKKEVSKKIFELIDRSKINNIPSDKFINDWQHKSDDVKYIIEYKTDKDYSFKHYWSPNLQENIEDAKRIQEFIDELYEICETENHSKQFEKEILIRKYLISNNLKELKKIMTKEEFKKYIKEKKTVLK